MNEREYLINVILTRLIEDIVDDLEFFPTNPDGEFCIKQYEKRVSDLADRVIEDKPIEIYKFIKEELKGMIEEN